MKKTFLFYLLFSLLTIVLTGCQSKESNQTLDNNEVLEKQISKVSISNSIGFEFNKDFFSVYEDKESIKIFGNAISKAVKQPGMVDIVEPDFGLEVTYTDGSVNSYHLWLDEKLKGAIIMNVYDTHTIYTISEEIATQLKDLI